MKANPNQAELKFPTLLRKHTIYDKAERTDAKWIPCRMLKSFSDGLHWVIA